MMKRKKPMPLQKAALKRTPMPPRKKKLTAKKGLTTTAVLKRATALARTKPMVECAKCPHRKHARACRSCGCAHRSNTPGILAGQAARFHTAVFARYGDRCTFCRKNGSNDAAHIIPKNLLGDLRYADERLARPAHRACHQEQHDGKRRFPVAVVRDAYAAHNAIATTKLQVPV